MPSSPHSHARPTRPLMSRALPLPALVIALLLLPGSATRPLHAQEVAAGADSAAALAARTVTLVGVVRDTAGRPLGGAEVRAGATQYTLSDDEGRFELTGVEPDTIQLLVRRIGYLPADILLEAGAGLRVELAVKLVPLALELGTIVVEGRRMSTRLFNNGFYERQRRGFGKLLGPEELDGNSATLSGLLHMVPSVLVERGPNGVAVAYGPSGTRHCPLNVYLDGVLIRYAGEVGLDHLVNRNHILAVEVYPRATTVPSSLSSQAGVSQLSGGLASPVGGAVMDKDTRCGALVIWSKPFDEKQEKRAGRRGR